jgi:hypothetical protein
MKSASRLAALALPMLALSALALSVLALAACQPQPATTAANGAPPAAANTAVDAAAGCNAAVETDWSATADTLLAIRATAWGPSCKQAVIALAMWGKDGPPMYSFISSMADIEGFDDVADNAALQKALQDWANGQADTTDGLPEWKEGEPSPDPSSEFPFYPDEGIDRSAYTAIRAGKHPMFCFVQGQESQQCVYLVDGGVQSVGVQTFPG